LNYESFGLDNVIGTTGTSMWYSGTGCLI